MKHKNKRVIYTYIYIVTVVVFFFLVFFFNCVNSFRLVFFRLILEYICVDVVFFLHFFFSFLRIKNRSLIFVSYKTNKNVEIEHNLIK
jgi:hypothetical protein